MFRDVSVNIGRNSRFGQHEVCALKKKIVLKTETNLHSVHRKTSKGKKEKRKKKKKRNEMNKGTCTINYKFI